MEKGKKPYSKPEIRYIDFNNSASDDTEAIRKLKEKATTLAAESAPKDNSGHNEQRPPQLHTEEFRL